MSVPGSDRPVVKRRRRLLSPSEKYDIWLSLIRGELTIAEAAAANQVDRSVIVRLKRLGKESALAGFAAARPGVSSKGRDLEMATANAEIERLSEAVKEMAVKLTLAEGKGAWS